MSVEPLSGGPSISNMAAAIAAEIAALSADAQTLSARLLTGDVVQAVVLASNGLTDLVEIGGLRVAAELPSTLLPGDIITVAVTGFSEDRIDLHIVPAPNVARPPLGLSPAAGRRAIVDDSDGPALEYPRAPKSEPSGLSGKPAVDQRSADPALPTSKLTAPRAAKLAVPAEPIALKSIEARLAAHATTAPAGRLASAPVPGASTNRAPLTPAVPVRPHIASRPAPLSISPAIAATSPRLPPANAAGTADFSDPATLLRALRLAPTASNLAAARLALDTPQKIPEALQALERALLGAVDGRLARIAMLTSFVARLEPHSPVLAAQVAAFVDQLVTGSEAKLGALVRAAAAADSVPARAAAAADATPAAAKSAAGGPTPATESMPADTTAARQSRPHEAAGPSEATGAPSLERLTIARSTLDYDLKTQLLALVAQRDDRSAGVPKSTALNAALAGAVTAITALQLNAATALNANPSGLAFSLPIALSDGFAQAHIRVDREPPKGRTVPLDGDDFHLGFVLETRHLGIVAIDLITVGRQVSLSVKTEAAPAQQVFAAAMSALTSRFEKLRYQVTSAQAVVAPPPSPQPAAHNAPSTPAPAPPQAPARLVDIDA